MELSSPLGKQRYWDWHKWFAWYPVIINFQKEKPRRVWLQTVARRLCETGGHRSDTYWKYHEPNDVCSS